MNELSIPRHELIATALDLGIERPESLTDRELADRIRRASEIPPAPGVSDDSTAGWLQVARHLVARVVEQGLNMPEAARLIDGSKAAATQRLPLPTVTLAQIYLSQGYADRAESTLRGVLEREPENPKARRLLAQLVNEPDEGAASTTGEDRPTLAEPLPSADSIESQGSASNESGASDGLAQVSATEASALDRDAVVIVRRDNQAFIYWELSAFSAERLAHQSLRVLVRTYEPAGAGARVSETTLDVVSATGFHRVDCDEGREVRAVLGVASDDDQLEPPNLEPLSVASSRCVDSGGALHLEFTPREGLNDVDVAHRALSEIG